jgi:hypothetical protein
MSQIDFSKFRNGVRNSLEKLATRLIVPNSGLWVLFEENDFELGNFQNEAFYTPKREYYDEAPQPIEEYLSRDFNHFIWIPKWISDGPEQRLVFRLAHECQHYRQNMNNYHKQQVREFRDHLFQSGWRPNLLAVERKWEEFDADREAYETFVDIYGLVEWENFVAKESENPDEREHFVSLQNLLSRWSEYQSSI